MMVQIRLPQTINIPAHYTDHGTGGLTAISSDTEYLSKITHFSLRFGKRFDYGLARAPLHQTIQYRGQAGAEADDYPW